jgi:hypothetical protein
MSKEVKEIGKMGALALLSQMPVVSAFSKFFEDYVNSNWQKRIELWKEETIKRLSKLDQDMEQKIRDMSNFANILATAQRGALEDIEEDKVGLYANAVINAIKNEEIDNTKTHIFLNMLRDFTKLHIEVLQELALLDNGIHPNLRHGRDSYIKQRIREKNPQLIEDIGMFRLTALELQQKGLCVVTVIDMADNSDYDNVITTSLGQEFLQFIAGQENSNG